MTDRVNRTSLGDFARQDSAADDIARRVDAIQRDRMQAYLDHASMVTGVSVARILDGYAAKFGADADVNRANILEVAGDLARPVPDTQRAVYHNPAQRTAARADANSDDDAFRASLAAKLPSAVPTAAATTDAAAGTDSDDAFRARLARLARGAQ